MKMSDVNEWRRFPRELLLDWNEPGKSFITVPAFEDGKIWRDNMFMEVDCELVRRDGETCRLRLPEDVDLWNSSLLRFKRRELFKSDFDDTPTSILLSCDEAFAHIAHTGQSYAAYCSKTILERSSKLAFLNIPQKNIKDEDEFWSIALPGDIIDIPKCAGVNKPVMPKRMYLETREGRKMGAIELDDVFIKTK